MLDIAVSYNRYKFIGHEFLTWLWYVIERDQGEFKDPSNTPFSLVIGNRIVCQHIVEDNTLETVTIKGDNAGLEEGLLALRKGALVTELSLSLNQLEMTWEFNLKGENLHVTGFKPPVTEKIEKKEDREGAILEKIFLYGKAVELMDHIYKSFLKLRISETWTSQTLNEIKAWIKG